MVDLARKLRRAYSLFIVRALWTHWFNPLYTLYFNFVFFPLRQAVRFPVYVYGWPRLFSQFGTMECRGVCRPGMVRLNVTIPGGPQYAAGNTQLNIWGKVVFRGACEIGSGNKINVGEGGVLDMGGGTKITTFCNVTAYSEIRVGEQSRIVHRCQVFDTNFHFVADFGRGVVPSIARPISIGDYCWICNSTTITGGAVIPDKTIVASNSLVGKDMSAIPPESIIGGVPAKLLCTGRRKVESRRFNAALLKYFAETPAAKCYVMPEDVDHSVCDVD